MIAALKGALVDYGLGPVLGPFDLSITAGEIIALVGPSGCGKSTAMRLLAALETPTGGEVTRRLERGETALVFQAPTLMPWATALDNVALPLALGSAPDACAQATTALERVGLAGAAKLKPAQLSGGMAMRVSLARALVAQPRLLLMDEPFAALDEITRRALADDVHRLLAGDGPAVVFVTHSVEEAIYMADRVVVMSPRPGRTVGEIACPTPRPRPSHYRTSQQFREAAEAVSEALQRAMTPA